jgi:hypothetical protein
VVTFEPKLFETKLLEPKPLEQPPSLMLCGMSWRLHCSLAGIESCLSDGCVQPHQSLRHSRPGVLSQRWRADPRRIARILHKEILKQHCGDQRYAGKCGASKHSVGPGGDLGLLGLGQFNMNFWSHDQFFLSHYQIGQSIRGGACGLREEDSIGRQKFPFSRAKMKLAGGNNSARAEVMDRLGAVNPQDPAA